MKIDNSAANEHNRKNFPHGIALTGDGVMCAKEYNELKASLCDAHVTARTIHEHEVKVQQARERQAARDLEKANCEFW